MQLVQAMTTLLTILWFPYQRSLSAWTGFYAGARGWLN